MANLSGWSGAFTLQPYGERLRQMRRYCSPIMNQRSILHQVPLLEKGVRGFLKRLGQSTSGQDVGDHLRWLVRTPYPALCTLLTTSRMNGGSILELVYGYKIQDKDDPFVKNADVAISDFTKIISPGWMVEFIPARELLTKPQANRPFN